MYLNWVGHVGLGTGGNVLGRHAGLCSDGGLGDVGGLGGGARSGRWRPDRSGRWRRAPSTSPWAGHCHARAHYMGLLVWRHPPAYTQVAVAPADPCKDTDKRAKEEHAICMQRKHGDGFMRATNTRKHSLAHVCIWSTQFLYEERIRVARRQFLMDSIAAQGPWMNCMQPALVRGGTQAAVSSSHFATCVARA